MKARIKIHNINIKNLIMIILVMQFQERHLTISGNRIQKMIILAEEPVLQENHP